MKLMISSRSVLVTGLAVACGLLLAYSIVGAQERSYPLLGKTAPGFSLDLAGGGKMSLADHKGKDIVVLDFWATWCPPCRMLMPIMVEVTDKYKSKGVVFYGVDIRESPEAIKAFQEKTALKFTAALDKDGKVSTDYGVDSIPMSVIIDKEGVIQAVHIGLAQDVRERITKELDTLVAGKSLIAPQKAPEPKKPEEKKPPEKK
jgi:thiol-disulfide isomerase/thioredoxin